MYTEYMHVHVHVNIQHQLHQKVGHRVALHQYIMTIDQMVRGRQVQSCLPYVECVTFSHDQLRGNNEREWIPHHRLIIFTICHIIATEEAIISSTYTRVNTE